MFTTDPPWRLHDVFSLAGSFHVKPQRHSALAVSPFNLQLDRLIQHILQCLGELRLQCIHQFAEQLLAECFQGRFDFIGDRQVLDDVLARSIALVARRLNGFAPAAQAIEHAPRRDRRRERNRGR